MALSRLALPDDQALPAGFIEGSDISAVPFGIAFQLTLPEGSVALGHHCIPTSRMLMPKTTVYKYYGSIPWENNVRFAGKIIYMEPEAEAPRMEVSSD
jgi:hypothetical protein